MMQIPEGMTRVIGFYRLSVMDDRTCEHCRQMNMTLLADAVELTEGCTSESGCRCVAQEIVAEREER